VTDPAGSDVPTWSVAELHEALNGLLTHVFGEEVWVEGEIRNLNRSAKGHVYFDLVDPGRDGDPTRPMLSVTLFDQHRQAVNRHLTDQGGAVRMSDGTRVRVRGRLNLYAPRSTLQLLMTWIDPAYTLGVMGLERDRVLALLAAEDLLDRNAGTPMAPVPLHLGLVTSIGSAAHADALDELVRARFGFRVTVVDTRTQGNDAERSIVAGLRVAADHGVDLVLLVRGGGARTDLAAFDTEGVARAIAECPVPVVTGIGHEVDRTVADEVAHSAHKTPTAAAASVADRARRVAHDLELAAAQLPAATRGRLVRAARRLDRSAHRAGRSASHHLGTTRRELDRLQQRAAAVAPRRLADADDALDRASARLGIASRRAVLDTDRRLVGLAARARAHDPAIALARGWSITRGADGRAVRSADGLAPGDELVTTLRDGTVRSTVVDHPTETQEPT
jgi:exodeoxyribonuclease VII large subunit